MPIALMFFLWVFSYSVAFGFTIDVVNNTADSLVSKILENGLIYNAGTPSIVDPADHSGNNSATGTFSDGTPTAFNSGVILTTGTAGSTGNQNVLAPSTVGHYTSTGDAETMGGDPMLSSVSSDATILEFYLSTEGAGTFEFEYIFATEDKIGDPNFSWNDMFGFFVGDNLAELTTNALGVDNWNTTPRDYSDFIYDYYTNVLTASYTVETAGDYKIKLAIADGGNYTGYDSAVFIREDSFMFTSGESSPVPEPATMILLGVGLVGLVGLKCRKK